ncbi:hypothetical protein Ancab_010980 [Ancistrocladus abbreviatus]
MGDPHPNSPDHQLSTAEFVPLDPEEFRNQAHQMVNFIADYYKNIETYPVLSQVQPGYLRSSLPSTAPYGPESLETILGDIRKLVIPGLTHWSSPNFFAFFPITVSTAAFLGEMLSTSFNCVAFQWLASPAATELEMVVMDWLAAMLKLPNSFMFSGTGGGVMQATTNEAIICTLTAARDRTLQIIGVDNVAKLVVYGSDQTHSSYAKACKIPGILPCNIRQITTTVDTNFALCAPTLGKIIEADVAAGLVPLYLCLSVGTISTTAVDPINQFVDMASNYYIWIHVDAAYGGSTCICPEFRHYLDGIERVESLSLNAYK